MYIADSAGQSTSLGLIYYLIGIVSIDINKLLIYQLDMALVGADPLSNPPPGRGRGLLVRAFSGMATALDVGDFWIPAYAGMTG